jgi:hypothetical protein
MDSYRPFTDVSFPRQYPPADVAPNEVLLAFVNDADAVAFHEWWNVVGNIQYQAWRQRPKIDDAATEPDAAA